MDKYTQLLNATIDLLRKEDSLLEKYDIEYMECSLKYSSLIVRYGRDSWEAYQQKCLLNEQIEKIKKQKEKIQILKERLE